ncbi:MAG: DUF5050 domain-containing protein [Eubacteriales bacterium]|nr:DUF5050 domain-containing protein [Eubacteriales bacterium]
MDEQERQKLRKKRQRARKRKRARKRFLIFLTILIVALAAFVITVKICNPDFDFSTLLPNEKAQQVVKFVNEDILGKTTTTEPQTTTKPTTTQPTTKAADYDYVEFSEFAFDTSLQGNQLGNLLNKTNGAVTYSSSYIYYSIPNKGIYRFEPNEEKNKKVKADNYNFKYLNILGDYIYFVDTDSNTLNRCQISGGDILKVSDNVSFAYLYNDRVYFIGADNTVGYIDTENFEKTVLFTGQADKTISFAGISLSRIFFVQHDNVADYSEYITVSLTDSNDRQYFRDDTLGDDIINLQLECGFMYYYQKQADGTYNLCRQKFGSENIVTLAEGCNATDYPVIYSNRLYYTSLDGSKMQALELNMNSMSTSVMVSVSDTDTSGTMAVGYGYQYVFLTGTRSNGGEEVFAGSCIYTSSSRDNTLIFSDGKLKYLE